MFRKELEQVRSFDLPQLFFKCIKNATFIMYSIACVCIKKLYKAEDTLRTLNIQQYLNQSVLIRSGQ